MNNKEMLKAIALLCEEKGLSDLYRLQGATLNPGDFVIRKEFSLHTFLESDLGLN